MRKLRTMDDVLLDGKIVLVRVDFNVSVGDDGVVDQFEDYRIQVAIPTIEELIQRRCKVVLLTHLGRPGKEVGDFDLEPVRRRLMDLLQQDVRPLKQLHGDAVDVVVAGMEPGSVALLPNVRLDEREVAGSTKFADELAAIGEVYINEAFSASHRPHTSIALIPSLLPSCAGRRTVAEYEVLRKLSAGPKRPYIAVVSGAKVSTKLKLLRKLVQQVDRLCLGGVIANTFLVSLRKCSLEQCAADELAAAEQLWSEAGDKIELPEDVVVGTVDGQDGEAATVSVSEIPANVGGVWDVGPRTVQSYLELCRSAQTVMWNGPLGKFEEQAYAKATHQFAEGLAELSGYRVVGGGDTVTALEQARLASTFDHVSVAGGAMVALLEGSSLPGLEPLFV